MTKEDIIGSIFVAAALFALIAYGLNLISQ